MFRSVKLWVDYWSEKFLSLHHLLNTKQYKLHEGGKGDVYSDFYVAHGPHTATCQCGELQVTTSVEVCFVCFALLIERLRQEIRKDRLVFSI